MRLPFGPLGSRAIRVLALGGLVLTVGLLVGPAITNPAIRVSGSIILRQGDAGPFVSATRIVSLRRVSFLGGTFVATNDGDGRVSVKIPPGRYEVSIEGCKSYGSPGDTRPQFNLHRDGSTDPAGFGALDWLIDPNGNCQPIPVGIAL